MPHCSSLTVTLYLLRHLPIISLLFFFFFNDTATTEIYTLSLHDALPIYNSTRYAPTPNCRWWALSVRPAHGCWIDVRSEEHTSELQSLAYLVCRLLLEKKKKKKNKIT